MSSQDLPYLRNYSECIADLNPSASCRPRTRCLLIYQQMSANQKLILSILKLVSFESLARNDISQWGTQVKARCERNLQL